MSKYFVTVTLLLTALSPTNLAHSDQGAAGPALFCVPLTYADVQDKPIQPGGLQWN